MAEEVAFRDSGTNVYSLLTSINSSVLTSKQQPSSDTAVVANPLNSATAQDETKAGEAAGAASAAAAGGGAAPPTPSAGEMWVAKLCLMVLGLGVAISWTTLRAGIAYFSTTLPLKAQVYTIMQICYNVPVLPLLLAQLSLDARYDLKFTSRVTYTVRICVALTILLVCLLTVPHVGQSGLLAICILVGIFDSTAYGTVTQFFALFPPSVGGFYFIGASLTAPVSIGLSFATSFNSSDPSSTAVIAMFTASAMFILLGIGAALLLLNSRAGVAYLAYKDAAAKAKALAELTAKARATSGMQLADAESPAATPGDASSQIEEYGSSKRKSAAGASGSSSSSSAGAAETGVWGILRQTYLCHIAIFVCWWGTNWTGSLISFLPSEKDEPGKPSTQFSLIILYASLLGELVGKQLNVSRRGRIIKGPGMLLIGILVRFSVVLLYLLYLTQPLISGNNEYKVKIDGLVIAYLAIDSIAGAYFSTLVYGIAPTLLSDASLRSRSSTLLSITLMLGLYLGLGCSIGLSKKLETIVR